VRGDGRNRGRNRAVEGRPSGVSVDEVITAHQRLADEGRGDAVARLHATGRLTARERVDLLLDDGSAFEHGPLVTVEEKAGLDQAAAPADGVLAFVGLVDGRPVTVMANDFSVAGGSMGMAGAKKMLWLGQLSAQRGIPFISLLDGGGHRIQEMDGLEFASGGPTPFPDLARLSGWAPTVAAVMGPAWAGAAGIVAMSDFAPMVVSTGSLGVAGAAFVEAATGERITTDALGGWKVHGPLGTVDIGCEDDRDCIAKIKDFLSYLPGNSTEPPPPGARHDPADRLVPELRDIVPSNRRRAYDVRPILGHLLDGGRYFELRREFARNVVVALGHIDGRPVGVMANQTMHVGGALDASGCDKLARFISFCDAFGLPLVSLIDSPGLLVGSTAESEGTVRRSARVLMALGHATVPIVSVLLRKCYGLAYHCMAGGRSAQAVAALLWPTAEVSAMGIEGAVDLAYRRDIERADDPVARRTELIDAHFDNADPIRAASAFGIDDVIDPADTRRYVARILDANRGRRLSAMPPKQHPIDPL
jgi:acetyl-CoA carboxylase carboxyltransferase component